MVQFLQSIIPFWIDRGLSSFWGSFIILFFLWHTVRFYQSYKPCLVGLDGVNKTLTKFSDKLPGGLEELNKEMLAKESAVSHFWSEFNETIVRTKSADGKDKIFNTIDSDHFFNETHLITPRLNLRFYNAVPGLLTGLGILGTFVGITYGLSHLSHSLINPDDTKKLQDGIQQLLSGANIAFTTSIWGILGSIIFSVFEKHLVNKLRKSVDDIKIKIDKLFTRKTPESWLSDIYWESCQQSKELKSFNTDLANDIGSALDERLALSLTPALDKLLLAIKDLNTAGVKGIADQISKSAGEEINRLTRILSRLGLKFNESIEKTQSIQKGMDDSLKENMGKFTKDISDFTTQLGEQTNNVSTTMQDQIKELSLLMHDQVEDVSERYASERTQINKLLQAQEETLKRLENIMQGAGLAAEAFKNSALPVQDATNKLQNAIDSINNMQGDFMKKIMTIQGYYQEMSSSIQESVSHMNESLETTKGSWQAYESKFGKVKNELNEVFEKLNHGLGEYQEITSTSIEKYLGSLDNSLSDATGHLASVIENFSDAIEELDLKK